MQEESTGQRMRENFEHTMDDTSGSSGFGFSIKSYIAMITTCQLSSASSYSSSFV